MSICFPKQLFQLTQWMRAPVILYPLQHLELARLLHYCQFGKRKMVSYCSLIGISLVINDLGILSYVNKSFIFSLLLKKKVLPIFSIGLFDLFSLFYTVVPLYLQFRFLWFITLGQLSPKNTKWKIPGWTIHKS